MLIDTDRLGLKKSEKFAIATSGGSDSTALCFLCKQAGFDFIAVIVDHKYRKNSSKEAQSVKNYLTKLGIKAHILTNKKPIPKMNVEEFMRDMRYGMLSEFCKKNKIKKVLTGHHLDDQIETFLMRLERGAGIDGLTGIKEITEFLGMQLVRPLLSYSKDELKNYLKKHKIKWWEDKTNKDTKLTRNNIRTALEGFSDYELMRKRLSGVIENIARAKDFIEEEKGKAYKAVVKESKNHVTLNLGKYRKLHSELRLRILRDLIKKYSKTEKDVRMDSIKHLDSSLLNKNFKKAELQGIKIEKTDLNSAALR